MKRKFATISPNQFYGPKPKKQAVSKSYKKMSRYLDKAMARKIKGVRRTRKSGRKTKRGQSMVVSPHHGVSFTRTNLVYRSNSAITKKLTQPSVWRQVQPLGLTSFWNQQGVLLANGSFDSVGPGSLMRQLFDKAASLINGAGTVTTPSINPNQVSYKFYLESVKSSFILTNQAPTDVEIDVYDCVARTSSEFLRTPTDAWNLGINQQDNDGTTTQFIVRPKASPFDSKLFNLNWKVVKKVTLNISPGRSHDHCFNHKINRLVDTSYFENFAQVKGITSNTFFVARGALGDSLNSNVVGIIGFTPVKVVMVQDRTFVTRIMNEHPRIYTYASFIDPIEPANVFTQDEGSGQPQNIGPAFRTTYA